MRRFLTIPAVWLIPVRPINIFFEHSWKHPESKSIHKPPKAVNSLFLLQPSRTVFNYSRPTSRSLVRSSLLSDLEGPSRSVPASSCFSPATHESKHLFSTSQNLVIVTNSKISDLFAEVSPTHYKLACGMLLLAYVSEFLWLYLIYVVSFCSFLLLYPAMCLEDFVLFASPFWVEWMNQIWFCTKKKNQWNAIGHTKISKPH